MYVSYTTLDFSRTLKTITLKVGTSTHALLSEQCSNFHSMYLVHINGASRGVQRTQTRKNKPGV